MWYITYLEGNSKQNVLEQKGKVIKTQVSLSLLCDVKVFNPTHEAFRFFCRAAGDVSSSCEYISPEMKHRYGQDRKNYYTVCYPAIVLTLWLMSPMSSHLSNGPIMMEAVARIMMCKLFKSSCSGGLCRVTPPIACDRLTNVWGASHDLSQSNCFICILGSNKYNV